MIGDLRKTTLIKMLIDIGCLPMENNYTLEQRWDIDVLSPGRVTRGEDVTDTGNKYYNISELI